MLKQKKNATHSVANALMLVILGFICVNFFFFPYFASIDANAQTFLAYPWHSKYINISKKNNKKK